MMEVRSMNGMCSTNRGSTTHMRVAAYHEAGHAVLALMLGIRIVDVSIDHLRHGCGRVIFWVPSLYPERYRASPVVAPFRWARLLSNEQRDAVFTLAGPLAEAKLLGLPMRTIDSIGDLETIHQLMRWPASGGEGQPHGVVRTEAKPFFEGALRRTRRVLSRPVVWNAVTEVAQDLLSWRRLKGDDVAESVQRVLGGGRQMGLFTGGRRAP